MNHNTEILVSFAVGSIVLFGLITFMILFLTIFQRRQQQFKQEKATLKAQFEQEILVSQNEVKEETMRYISRELHDNVAQMLSLVKIQLNGIGELLPHHPKVMVSKDYLTAAINDLRALSKTLNTDNILHEGLAAAIDFELHRIEKISDITIHFTKHNTRLGLDAKQEIVVFRIFQELLQNVVKHAHAKNMSVCLEESKGIFKLEVQDDGVGFDFETKLKNKGFESGSGLTNMVYRAHLLGGRFEVSKAPSQGSISTLTIPLPQHNENSSPH